MGSVLLMGVGGKGAPGIETDPHWANVTLLMKFEDVDASTTFTDSSTVNCAFSVTGNAQIDTAQFKFGASSYLGDGTGDRITQNPVSHSYRFGTNDFTIEGFFRPAATSATSRVPVSVWSNTINLGSWQVYYTPNGASGLLGFQYGTGASSSIAVQATVTINANTWYHFAVDKDAADKIRVYLDGVMIASQTESTSMAGNSQALRIGDNGSAGNSVNGHLDNIRITETVARYASDSGFTVPVTDYPTS